MDEPMTVASEPFELEPPPTQSQILRDLWKDMKQVKAEVKRTNGRVTRLEKGALAAIALVIGFLAAYGLNLPRLPGL